MIHAMVMAAQAIALIVLVLGGLIGTIGAGVWFCEHTPAWISVPVLFIWFWLVLFVTFYIGNR